MRSASTRQSLRARPSTLCDPTSGFRILCIELGLVMGHSRGETLPRNECAAVVQAFKWSVERDSRVALWFRLISDDQSPSHFFVAAPAEDVTREAQFSRLIWREHDASDFTRLDLGRELEIREAESMDPV